VNVLTGETPAQSQATVEEAKEFAASIDTETPQIALPASVESQVETQSKPYTAAVFFHFKTTGSLELHRAYQAAYKTDAFVVDFEADYESGDLTITVERANEARESAVTRSVFRAPAMGAGAPGRTTDTRCVGGSR
jgi:hypothetical protein